MARTGSFWVIVGRAALGAAAVAFAVPSFIWMSLPDTRRLKTDNPGSTAFMQMRVDEALRAGRPMRLRQHWVPLDRMAPVLRQAVLVSEDAKFWDHDGLDYDELRISIQQDWARGRLFRGASTITQQLAKNLYLSASKTPTRKFAELLLTRRLEAELPKRRILELYLNLIEWGDGIWGADAAARAYFGVPASDVSAPQAALLAGAIINPRIYNPSRPSPYLLRRQQTILERMRF